MCGDVLGEPPGWPVRKIAKAEDKAKDKSEGKLTTGLMMRLTI
jgi:hypothetical protein